MSAHVRERLSAYLDGELDSAGRSTIDAHLAQCPACSTLLERLALVDPAVAALALPETKDDGAFAARVRAKIEAEGERSARAGGRARVSRALPAWTWAAVAALLVAVVTPLTLRQLRPSGASSALDAVAPERPMEYEEKGMAEPQAATPVAEAERTAPASAGRLASSDQPVATPRESRLRESVALQDSAAPDRELAPRAPSAPAPAPRTTVAERVGSEAAVVESAAATSVEGGVAGGVVGGIAGGVAEERLAFAVGPEQDSADHEAATAKPMEPVREERQSPERLARAKAAAPASSADAHGGASAKDAPAFARLAAQRPKTAEEWRRLREAWRELAHTHRGSPLADEALVRAIAAAAAAYRASADSQDERVLRRDVADYLARKDAAHAERVRLLLREAER